MSSKLNASAKPFVPGSSIDEFELVSTPIAEPDKAALTYPFSFNRDVLNNVWQKTEGKMLWIGIYTPHTNLIDIKAIEPK